MAEELIEFDESLMPAEEPAELAAIELDERHMEYARRRWPTASERMQQYRVRQAIWVRFQHAKPHPDDPSRRIVGGPQPGSGRKSTKRIGAALVEAAQERAKEIVDAAFAPIAQGNDPMERHKAAMNIAKHEREQVALDMAEDEYARRSEADIQREAAEVIAEMVRDGEISLEDLVNGREEPVDADVVEDVPPRLSA